MRLNYTDEVRCDLPPEPNHRTESKWKQRAARLLRLVDDGFCLSRVNFENSFGFHVNGLKDRVKHAVQSQNVFRHLVRNAVDIGMRVNTGKTTLVCFSDAQGYQADAYLEDGEGNTIRGTTSMKALGVRFSNRPDWGEHIKWIKNAFSYTRMAGM